MSSKAAAAAAQSANRVIPVHKKYTLQSTGIWEKIRRAFAVDPTRSNGVPLNPQFRNPPPGANDPFEFTDAVTIPAADLADNPYWKRDVRRNYPQRSVIRQTDMASLLTIGSAQAPKQDLIGESGTLAVVKAREEAQTGLAAHFGKDKASMADILSKDGLPPLPSGRHLAAEGKKYELTEENAYPEEYPCRTFV